VKRGDLVRIALSGDYGKPRPGLVIQSDAYNAHAFVTVLPVTSTLADIPLLRVNVVPDEINNLQKPSQIMIDKLMTIPRGKVGPPFGRATEETMLMVTRNLMVFLGIAG
jgi:mRNA interferase MazF